VNAILGKDPDIKPPWDIVFTLNDPHIMEQALPIFNSGTIQVLKDTQEAYKNKLPPEWQYKIISYYPVDSAIKGNWVNNVISLSDYPVAYTQYGKEEIVKADVRLSKVTGVEKKLDIIYHGVDLENFKPLPEKEVKEFKSKFFSGVVKEDTFLIIAVARNQLRKDLPRTLAIFKEFQKRRPDSFLYLHCQETDAWGSLREYANQLGLEFGKDWGVPQKFQSGVGYPVEVMNLLYNAADAVISTTLGEGWGFYNTEEFATKTIVVAPDNTVHPELFNYKRGDDISDMNTLFDKGVRGVPVKARSNLSEWATYGPDDLERMRPLTNVEDAVKKLIWVYDNPDKVAEIEQRAYDWVQTLTWESIGQQWDELFTRVYSDLQKEREGLKKKKNGNSKTGDRESQRSALWYYDASR
jgi:glycosyltransferase involved in cell wall biosynthesis